MADPIIMEGTWEELAEHAEEFKGQHLKLIVYPNNNESSLNAPDQEILRARMQELFAQADKVERQPGKPLTDPSERAFGEIMDEKYRKLGFKL